MLILAEKELEDTLELESCEISKDAKTRRKVMKACSVICRGLGDVPMAAIMEYSECPKLMWDALNKRYASRTVFNKAKVLTELLKTEYKG